MFSESQPQSICLIRLSAIGDTCHALAVARNLIDNWPGTKITWIIGRTEASLIGDIAGIEFIIFDKSKSRAAYADIKQQLGHRHFDVILCMHASMRVNRLCRLVPGTVRLGFDRVRARDFQWLFTNARIPAKKHEHALDAMMGFARALHANPTPLRWDIPLSDAHRAFARTYTAHPCVVISPCSSQRKRNYRNWPQEHFGAVARYAQQQFACRIILTGGSTAVEREYGESIAAQAGPDIVNLIGKTNLKQSLALFEAADVVLCPDSGPAHMATAVGTPVIGLYASSNPDRTGPYLSRQLTVNRYPDAVRKYLKKSVDAVRWGRRVRHPEVMSLISIEDVTQQLDAVFKSVQPTA